MSAGKLPIPNAAGHCLFRCSGCRFEIECLTADAARYSQVGCPACGAAVEPVELPPAEALPPNKRLVQRQLVRGGARAEVRRGSTGLGPNLALGLADLSEDGLGVRLRAALQPKDECEVLLHRPGGGKPVKLFGEVRWCVPEADGTFRAGVRFQRRLARRDLMGLVKILE